MIEREFLNLNYIALYKFLAFDAYPEEGFK